MDSDKNKAQSEEREKIMKLKKIARKKCNNKLKKISNRKNKLKKNHSHHLES